MAIILSNSSHLPIYEQIKLQLREQILNGELKANDQLPSLRALARDLRISILTCTRAYGELEREGFITSVPGKGFFVASTGMELRHEQLIREIEEALQTAIRGAQQVQMGDEDLMRLLRLLLDTEEDQS